MSLSQSDYDPDVWGWIKRVGAVYTAYDFTGTNYNPNIQQQDSGNEERRAYFSFDTSGIADGAVVDLAEFPFKLHAVTDPVGFSGTYQLSFYYDWDRIGVSISTDDWDFSSYGGVRSWVLKPLTNTEYTASLSNAAINKAGDTDIEVRSSGSFMDPPGPTLWRMVAYRNSPPGHRSYLTVGYLLQGVLGKTPSGNIGFYGGMCLVALSKLLMQSGIIPPMSRVDRVEGSDIHVVTRFVPRTVMGACS